MHQAPYLHLRDALTKSDIDYLKDACKRHLTEDGIPCYVLISRRASPTYLKIKELVEQQMNEPLYYLNDFYIYTDSSFKTSWHMDTELFTFNEAVNAWILLSPETICGPLGFVDQINVTSESLFHSMRIEGDKCIFGNFCNGAEKVMSLRSVEENEVHTPQIDAGDILLFNPKRFHRTKIDCPKHAIAIKFVRKSEGGFLSNAQVDPSLWGEVDLFNRLLERASNWEEFISSSVRDALGNEVYRKQLSAGFYPAQFDFYKQMVSLL